MEDLGDKIERLKSVKLTRRQLEIMELLEEGLSHKEIAERLAVELVTVQYHMTNIFLRLGIYHLPRGQRQRELGKYAMALKSLKESANPAENQLEAISLPEHEAQVQEPSPQALALIQAVTAVLEDERALVLRENQGTDAAQVTPSQASRHIPLRRRLGGYQWLLLAVTFLIGLVAGVGTITLLAGNLTNRPGNESMAQVSPSAESRPTSASETEVASSSPSPSTQAVPVTPAVASVCGETARVTAPDQVRLVRTEGVSVFSVENTNGGVLDNKVRALAVDARGLWIGYYATDPKEGGGVGQYDKATWANCKAGDKGFPVASNVNALATDQAGRLWVATETRGVVMFDGTSWHAYSTEEGLPINSTFGLTIDKDNNAWVATLEGVAKYDAARDRWSTIYTAENRTLAYNNTHIIAFDSTDNIWVGHINHGVSRYSKADNRWIHYDMKTGELSGNKIRSIVVQDATTERPTGGVWIATADGGVSRFTDNRWLSYHMADGLPSEEVGALAIDRYHRVWAATMGGVVYFDGARWIPYHNLPALSIAIGADCATCPFEQNEHVWTGTVSNGLTHSRLPYADQAATVTEVCFSSQRLARTCQQYPVRIDINGMEVITATYPETLAPGETFQSEIFVAPNPPYKFRVGDMLVTTDDPIVFGTFEHIAVQGTVESAQPFKFADYNVPFIAPNFEGDEQERTFVSTWRLWMHTRYAGPYLRIVATVRRSSATPTP